MSRICAVFAKTKAKKWDGLLMTGLTMVIRLVWIRSAVVREAILINERRLDLLLEVSQSLGHA